MNKKILIAVIAVIVVAVSIMAYLYLITRPPPEDLTISYSMNEETATISVSIGNEGDENITVERVELIYVPENISIVWLEQLIVEPEYIINEDPLVIGGHKSVRSNEMVNGASGLFNLLIEAGEGDVKIIVTTTKATYSFVPYKEGSVEPPKAWW